MDNLDRIISEFKGKEDHKTAYRTLIKHRTTMQLREEVGIPRVSYKPKTWKDYLRETTWGERVAAFFILALLPLFSWLHLIITGQPLQF